jgi:hypothetical protein
MLPRYKRLIRSLVILVAVIVLPTMVLADSAAGPGLHLKDMHHHPWFPEVLASSAVGWVIGLVKGFSGTREWLARYWPNTPLAVVFIMDLIVFVGVGAYFGTGIYNPANFLAAMGAGLTWPIGLGSLVTK